MKKMNILKNRYEVMALVQARMCNPNGDPDMANMPRMDFETNRGIITDVAYKARIRNYAADAYRNKDGYAILMRNANSVNKAIAEAVINVNGETKVNKSTNKKSNEAAAFMCEKYWDVRTFGAVLSTGLNAGQVRGAVQVGMSLSVDPIEPTSATITRCCYTNGDYSTLEEYDDADAKMDDHKKRTFGNKSFIPYGLYVMTMTISANLAEKVGFTEEDMRVLLESVVQMYNTDASSSKMGMSVLTPIVVFKHVGITDPANTEQLERECKLGCAPAYKLFDMLTIKRKENVDVARSYKDYEIKLHMEKLPAGVECGVKSGPYTDIEWIKTTDTIDLLEM